MAENLLIYGTIQRDDVQLELFRRIAHSSKDILKDYKAVIIKITDK